MKKELKAVICVVLSVWFFLMGFEIGSYHEKKDIMATSVPVINQATTAAPNTMYDAPTSTTAPTTDIATTAAPSTTASGSNTQATQATKADETTKEAKADPSSMSKTEILMTVTEAINKLKSEPNFKARNVENTTINVTECSADAAKNLINNVIQKFAGEDVANYEFVNGQATGHDDSGNEIKDEGVVTPKDVIPPKKALFTISEEGIKEATAVKDGDGVVYTLKVVEESTQIDNPIPNFNSQGIGYLNLADIDVPGATITEANMHYPESVITVTMNGEGKITKIHYYLPMDGSGAAKMAFISGTAKFEGSNDEVWEFSY